MNERFLMSWAGSLRESAVDEILQWNTVTERYGLTLSATEARELVSWQAETVQGYGRVEFGNKTLIEIMRAFADSPFIIQSQYVETLADLVEAFYYLKNETLDQMTDEELIQWMKERYNGHAHGSMDLLVGREADHLIRSIRFGEEALEEEFEDGGEDDL